MCSGVGSRSVALFKVQVVHHRRCYPLVLTVTLVGRVAVGVTAQCEQRQSCNHALAFCVPPSSLFGTSVKRKWKFRWQGTVFSIRDVARGKLLDTDM